MEQRTATSLRREGVWPHLCAMPPWGAAAAGARTASVVRRTLRIGWGRDTCEEVIGWWAREGTDWERVGGMGVKDSPPQRGRSPSWARQTGGWGRTAWWVLGQEQWNNICAILKRETRSELASVSSGSNPGPSLFGITVCFWTPSEMTGPNCGGGWGDS